MSEHNEAAGDVAEGEWESAVQRISEKLKAGTAGGGESRLAEELVRLEQRALEAEDTLARERHAYTGRVREMETKLKKLEPWLHKLKTRHTAISAERDQLMDRLSRLEENTQLGVDADREAHDLAVDAAVSERNAARRELDEVRRQNEARLAEVHEVWQQRLREAEDARDAVKRDLDETQHTLKGAGRSADELAAARARVEELETTLADERAAAREAVRGAQAAGEAVESERRRAEEAAESARQRSDELSKIEASLQSTREDLGAANRVAEEARAEATDARRALAENEASVSTLSDQLSQQRSRLDAKSSEAGSAQQVVEQLQATIDLLREETAESNQVVAKLRDDVEAARRNNQSLREELQERRAELESAVADSNRTTREAADLTTRASELEQLVGQARHDALTASQEAAERLAAVERERDEERAKQRAAEDRARDLDGELTDAKQRGDVAESGLADVRATLASLEDEHAGLVRTLADERELAEQRAADAAATARTQQDADRAAHDAEVQRLRTEIEDLRVQVTDADARNEREASLHAEQIVKMRGGISTVVTDVMRRLASGVETVVGKTIAVADAEAPELDDFASVDDADVEGTPVDMDMVAPESGTEWDQLLTNLEALRSEVEDFRPESLLPDTELHSFDALADSSPAGESGGVHEQTASIADGTAGPDMVGTQTLQFDGPPAGFEATDEHSNTGSSLSVDGHSAPIGSSTEEMLPMTDEDLVAPVPKKKKSRRRSRGSK